MSERIQMNTKSLQKHFPDVYSDFFSKNDLVVSGCFNFPWNPRGGLHASKYTPIKNKIPMKCYIGFKIKKERGISFKSILFFDITEKDFKTISFLEISKEERKIIDFVQDLLDINTCDFGIEISILTETIIGHGFGFSGTFSAILVTGIYLLINKLKLDFLQNYKSFLNTKVFNDIKIIAWKLDSIFRYNNTLNHAVIGTLIDSKDPFFVLCENFSFDLDSKLESIFLKETIITEKFKNTLITSDISLDYGMIYSGIPTKPRQIEQFKRADINEYDEHKKFIEKEILGEDVSNYNIYLKKFIGEESVYNNFSDIIIFLNTKIIRLFKELFEKGFNNETINAFIDCINNHRYAISILEKQSSFAENLIYFFRKNRLNDYENIGVMPTSSGKLGGGYVVVMKPGISRETLVNTIKDMKNCYPNIEIEYASYLDGECSDGVKIEQYLSRGIFSSYIQKDKVLYKDNNGESYIGDYEYILKKENKGLILDTISNKIYFKGEKLTSKEISSQNATIEILEILLENIGKDVSNKEFSASSYSKNRNEMFSKISVPLNKLLSCSEAKESSFKCSGGITDFYVRLDKSDINIGIIRRI
ncbi:MAG: hypothetical protein PHF46_01200 [Candidatus Gracilibacteria bacterium]|nr:hypothetical protein [Candidatus Gracilibacteria bacterium]MDD3120007.1 hypothetical protein [Candidatus Gracilibacteria bacterium]MDD4530000.1 hypothetical protein [Candidatus Gracilibacteria bacterium]